MIQLSECEWCSDTCRDYIQKYSYTIGIQLEMLKPSFFRTLGVIQRFISSVFSSLWLSIQHLCKSDQKVSRQEPRMQRENKACEKFKWLALCQKSFWWLRAEIKLSYPERALQQKQSFYSCCHVPHSSHVFCFLQIKFLFYSYYHQKTAKCLSFLFQLRCPSEKNCYASTQFKTANI